MTALRLSLRSIALNHPIGPIHLVARQSKLLALDFGNPADRLIRLLKSRFGGDVVLNDHGGLDDIATAVRQYLNGRLDALAAISFDMGGTPFQQQVWHALRTIPAGETRTYGQMAVSLGNHKAARAVGLANAFNPFNLVVPCHRLVGSNGDLTGYGGGIERKRWLLAHEANQSPRGHKTSCRVSP